MRIKAWWVALGLIGTTLSPAWAGDASPDFNLSAVAPGVYVHRGVQAEATAANHGDIANIGFIVGRWCVAVIDTGGSPWVGRHLRKAIAGVTSKPVCYVINTHMHLDHVLGNRAFTNTDAVFIAADRFPRALAARASTYVNRAAQTLGTGADSSWIVMPDKTVTDTREIDLGDRTLVLRAWPTAHTDNDLTVYDRRTKTLWLSDLLFVDRVPSLDGSVTGWLDALDRVGARDDISQVVPGHGAAGDDWRAAIAAEHQYLDSLFSGVRQAIDQGHTIKYTVAHVARDAADEWLLFDDYNARNVTTAYTELEWQ